jgi:hypothetical protein
MNDRVKGGIAAPDPLDGRLDELERREVARPDKLGLGGGIRPSQLVVHIAP